MLTFLSKLQVMTFLITGKIFSNVSRMNPASLLTKHLEICFKNTLKKYILQDWVSRNTVLTFTCTLDGAEWIPVSVFDAQPLFYCVYLQGFQLKL